MENEDIEVEIITSENPAVGFSNNKPKYHSKMEERLVGDILRVDLDVAKKEMDNRVIVQSVDNNTNIPCFNATFKKVIVVDDNGKRLLIDNHEQMKEQALFNNGKHPCQVVNRPDMNVNQSKIDDDYEDDVEFDF